MDDESFKRKTLNNYDKVDMNVSSHFSNFAIKTVLMEKDKQIKEEIRRKKILFPYFEAEQEITELYCSSVDEENDEKKCNRKYARSLPSFLSAKSKISLYINQYDRPSKKFLKRSHSCPQKFLALPSSSDKGEDFIPLPEKQVVPWKRRCTDLQHNILSQKNLSLVKYSGNQNDSSITSRLVTSLKQYFCSKAVFIFPLLVLSACVLIHFLYLRCDHVTFDLTKIKRTLHSELYGQNLSRQILLESFINILSIPPSKIFSVFLFIGRPGTGKTFMASLLSRHFPSSSVHSFVASAHNSWDYHQGLQTWITSHISSCSPSLLIFDDLDENHSYLFREMDEILKNWHTVLPSKFNQPVIFVLISSSSSWHIDKVAVNKYVNDQVMTESDMKILTDSLKGDSYAWYKDLQKHNNFHIVPFLPLNKDDIKICIKDYLKKRHFKISDEIVNRIADEMEYFPKSNPVFSKSGCKLVSTKVEMIIS